MNRFNSTFPVKPAKQKPRNYAAPRSLSEALARKVARDEKRRLRGQQRPKAKGLGRGKGLKAKPDRKLAEWGRRVKERDGNQCQWPGIEDYIADADFKIPIKLVVSPCATGDTRIDPHHKAKRSQRRDLKYELSNGIALCRTHHNWTDDNHDAAVAIGLLDTTSRELARKDTRRHQRGTSRPLGIGARIA